MSLAMNGPCTPRMLIQHAALYEQWSTLIAAGVPMLRALENLRRGSFTRRHRRMLGRVIERLEAGDPLPDAIEPEGRLIPGFDQALIRTGDRSGRLDHCLKDLAGHYRLRARWLNQAISACTYPLLLLGLSLVLFPVDRLVTGVVEGDWAPFLAHKAQVAGFLATAVFLVMILLRFVPRLRWIRGLAEQVGWRIPILGSALRERALARLILALDALLNTGMGVVEAWPEAAAASGSIRLQNQVRRWTSALESGNLVSESLASSKLFPDLFTDAYRVGESSGKLEETLAHLRGHYEESSTHTLEQVSVWVPRAVYIGVVCYVGLSVFRFWQGYFAQFDAYL